MKYKFALTSFFNWFWKIFLGISVIISVLGAFSNFEYTKKNPLLVGTGVIVLTVIISLVLVVKMLIDKGLEEKKPLVLSTELVNIVTRLSDEKKYLDVVRFGSTVGRYLHLTGSTLERIEIGKLVEDAASKEGRIPEQISALIDDLGWSKSLDGDSEKAKRNINSGIDLALRNHMYYFAAKGERHLSGIEKHAKNISQFKEHLKKAEEYTAQIIDHSEKNEMEASLYLAKAKYAFETNELNDAESYARQAFDKFKYDKDRQVKVHALLGNIYFTNNKIQEAKDEFNKGYTTCKDIRKDEYARNAVGLAKIALSENDNNLGKMYLLEAKAIGKASLKASELIEIERLLKSIKS